MSVWTLTASNRLGTVGAPIVDHGPRIEPYTFVEVVPAEQHRGAVEENEKLREGLRAALDYLELVPDDSVDYEAALIRVRAALGGSSG